MPGMTLAVEPMINLGRADVAWLDDGTQRQVQITPPLNVGHVTERTAHGDTCALVHFRGLVRQNRHRKYWIVWEWREDKK